MWGTDFLCAVSLLTLLQREEGKKAEKVQGSSWDVTEIYYRTGER